MRHGAKPGSEPSLPAGGARTNPESARSHQGIGSRDVSVRSSSPSLIHLWFHLCRLSNLSDIYWLPCASSAVIWRTKGLIVNMIIPSGAVIRFKWVKYLRYVFSWKGQKIVHGSFWSFALALVFLLVLEEVDDFISSPFGRFNLGYLQGKLIGFTAQ